MPALFYFHVPKTAGTSMINEIMQHFVASETLTENGNLTLPYLQAYGKERLRELGFIHGHPGAGVATYLQGITDTVLLLRNPMDHAISNYLSLLRDPGARLHHVAAGLGFRDFLYAYPRVLAFQTRSLTGGWDYMCGLIGSMTACLTCFATSKARFCSAPSSGLTSS